MSLACGWRCSEDERGQPQSASHFAPFSCAPGILPNRRLDTLEGHKGEGEEGPKKKQNVMWKPDLFKSTSRGRTVQRSAVPECRTHPKMLNTPNCKQQQPRNRGTHPRSARTPQLQSGQDTKTQILTKLGLANLGPKDQNTDSS